MYKYKPWKGCSCSYCRASARINSKINHDYKRTHNRMYRHISRKRLHKGNYDNFTISAGYRA